MAPDCARYGIRSAAGATCLALDEARGVLWAGASSGFVKMWDLQSADEVGMVQQAHDRDVSCMLHLNACDAMATAGADNMICIWSCVSYECLISLMGHTGPVDALGVCTNSMHLFSSSSSDATIRAWALDDSLYEDKEPGASWSIS